MAGTSGRVRRRRSGPVVAVTGAAGELGSRVARRLCEGGTRVVAIDTSRGHLDGVTWRMADVRDPALRARLAGADTVVHLAASRDPSEPAAQRRTVNVRGTGMVLGAAADAGVRRVVLVTSAMVYGAQPDNPVPLPDDAAIRAPVDSTLVGDWVEVERTVAGALRAAPDLRVVVVRPASLVGAVAVTDILPRMFEAPRLLAIKDAPPLWQFCHVDDLVTAVVWAAEGRVEGPVTVACDGWLSHAEVERVTGRRSVVVPARAAFAAAERLHRVGVLPAPAAELPYLTHPWVVGADRLRAAGWSPAWDNVGALRAHLDELGDRRGSAVWRDHRKDATRAAAGATVAIVGAVAVARARARRRRRGG